MLSIKYYYLNNQAWLFVNKAGIMPAFFCERNNTAGLLKVNSTWAVMKSFLFSIGFLRFDTIKKFPVLPGTQEFCKRMLTAGSLP
jgi:hypothetical protein